MSLFYGYEDKDDTVNLGFGDARYLRQSVALLQIS